jgi:LmbE family N-acetylglucosaminyl deacetylase
VLSFDPWGHYEENPDHVVSAQAVEAACWMAAGHLDLPEHAAMGLAPRAVGERYYTARGPQLLNRVVEITSCRQTKLEAICACRTQLANMTRVEADRLRAEAAPQTARAYAEGNFLPANEELGRHFGVGLAEGFHHIRSLP